MVAGASFEPRFVYNKEECGNAGRKARIGHRADAALTVT